jgi:hypothetical protein
MAACLRGHSVLFAAAIDAVNHLCAAESNRQRCFGFALLVRCCRPSAVGGGGRGGVRKCRPQSNPAVLVPPTDTIPISLRRRSAIEEILQMSTSERINVSP